MFHCCTAEEFEQMLQIFEFVKKQIFNQKNKSMSMYEYIISFEKRWYKVFNNQFRCIMQAFANTMKHRLKTLCDIE